MSTHASTQTRHRDMPQPFIRLRVMIYKNPVNATNGLWGLLLEFLGPVHYQGQVGRILHRSLHHKQALTVSRGLE